MTLRTLAAFGGKAAPDLDKVDRALRALPVTATDRAARCERYDAERVSFTLPAENVRDARNTAQRWSAGQSD